ncbi:unnamed protein product [Soboliphyme baturini]|uniref:PH domain-containing protein n=1 Tax=Soboliphyme baturini TaxID=241478 RepID=A0A183J6I6_9BILA|nr:unnamed protein product [Soboliphyme baturini]
MWCVLNSKMLKFYHKQTSQSPFNIVACDQIVMISLEPLAGLRSCFSDDAFSLYYVDSRGSRLRHLTFTVENRDELVPWINFIGMRFQAVGNVYAKRGSTGIWLQCTLIISDTKLLYSLNHEACCHEVDMRKIINIKVHSSKKDQCALCTERGPCLALWMEGGTLFLQADFKAVTEIWQTIITSFVLVNRFFFIFVLVFFCLMFMRDWL